MPITTPSRVRRIAVIACGLGSAIPLAAQGFTTAVSGVVRDQRGLPQVGVLVELSGASRSLFTVTDLQGRYSIRSFVPGVYSLRASAAMVVPTGANRLNLYAGRHRTVDLTLGTLGAGLLPFEGHPDHHAEDIDDWHWTLRSPVNRPMLRWAGTTSPPSEEKHNAREQRVRVRTLASKGDFATPPEQIEVSLAQRYPGNNVQSTIRVRESTIAGGSFSGMDATWQQGTETAGREVREVLLFHQLPGGGGANRTASWASVAGGERFSLAESACVEAGARTHLISYNDQRLVASKPFLSITYSPRKHWGLAYHFATEAERQSVSSLGESSTETVPFFGIAPDGRLTMSDVHHQGISGELRVVKVQLRVAAEADSHRTSGISAVFAGQPPSRLGGARVIADPRNQTLRALVGGYHSYGAAVFVDVPLTQAVRVQGATGGATGLLMADHAGNFHPASGPWSLIAVQARMRHSGTQLQAAYRWQPKRFVTVLSPFQDQTELPYLSVHLQQRLLKGEATRFAPVLTADAQNVLSEGTQSTEPGTSVTSSLHQVQAGLAVTF